MKHADDVFEYLGNDSGENSDNEQNAQPRLGDL